MSTPPKEKHDIIFQEITRLEIQRGGWEMIFCLVTLDQWRRKWQPTSVYLPKESHGQRSLVGYSPQGHTESDMTEVI